MHNTYECQSINIEVNTANLNSAAPLWLLVCGNRMIMKGKKIEKNRNDWIEHG